MCLPHSACSAGLGVLTAGKMLLVLLVVVLLVVLVQLGSDTKHSISCVSERDYFKNPSYT